MKPKMMVLDGLWRDFLRAPTDEGAGGSAGGDPAGGAEGEGGAAGGAGGEGGGGDPAGDKAGGDGGTSADEAAAAAEAAGSKKPWHEQDGKLTGPQREWLKARGMLENDPEAVLLRAITGHMAAEKALGKGADKLMDRPKEGQSSAEWLRENAKAFGIPETADAYDIAKPEMPEGMEWDAALEGKFREIAHAQGMTPDQVNASVGVFAENMVGMFTTAGQELQVATQAMNAELERDWGDQYPAKVAAAQAASRVLGSEAGLSEDNILAIGELLKPKIGDAGIMKLFAAVGAKLSDDELVGIGAGLGGATTPADAAAELAQFTSPEGDYGKAYRARDRAEVKRLEPRRQRLIELSAKAKA